MHQDLSVFLTQQLLNLGINNFLDINPEIYC